MKDVIENQNMSETNTIRLSDYSLVGKDTALAIEKGLAEATWYTSPVPRQTLRELLERKDGPALRDTFIWFALIIGSGVCGFLLWGTWWAIIPFAIYGMLYAPRPIPAGTNRATARRSRLTG